MADTDSLDEVEREIRSTRHRIDDHLDALLGKVSASHLIGDAITGVRREGGEFAASLGQRAKENPVATTMAVAGLAWLMVSDRSSNRASSIGRYPLPVPVGEGTAGASTGSGDSAGERARAAMRQARDTSASAVHAVGDTARQAGDAARGAADAVRSGVRGIGESAGRARETVVETTTGTVQGARDATRRAGDFLAENPLMVGAIGLMIGGLIAAALPSTRREDELVGETADQFKREAGAVAREAVRESEKVVGAAVQGAEEEAEHQDLGGRTAEKALKGGTEVAKSAVRSAGKEARRAGNGNSNSAATDAKSGQGSTATGSGVASAVPSSSPTAANPPTANPPSAAKSPDKPDFGTDGASLPVDTTPAMPDGDQVGDRRPPAPECRTRRRGWLPSAELLTMNPPPDNCPAAGYCVDRCSLTGCSESATA